jgi:sulfhydrogenase subunit beta (sulfur reductase)
MGQTRGRSALVPPQPPSYFGQVRTGDSAIIDRLGLDDLITALGQRGFRTLGPIVRDGAIVHGEVGASSDLPVGWHDEQGPGSYRLRSGGEDTLFDWAVGPASWKSEFFPPQETIWRATVREGEVSIVEPTSEPPPVAILGARPCELAALDILDRVLKDGEVPDPGYTRRRQGSFVVVVECGSPSASCFCTSMDTGPSATDGYDLALTELTDPGDHRFLVRVGSEAGAEVLEATSWCTPAPHDFEQRDAVVTDSSIRMGRSLDTDSLAALLARNLDHPRWEQVADRCLSCGNCTLVCPTCFCSDVDDVSDLSGTVERQRSWASCFDLAHSYIRGGPVRPTTSSCYRQWLTHKLSTWWDQFDTSGCVGCGRCVTWCPVGIDITEEAAAIRATDGSTDGGRRE